MSAPPVLSTPIVITADSEPYWKGFDDGVIRLPWCADCGKAHLPPGPVCPHCLSDALKWRDASGRGTVSTWVVVRRQYFAHFPPPYVAVHVELEEGPRMPANITMEDYDRIRVGLPVQADFQRAPHGMTLPLFRPVE